MYFINELSHTEGLMVYVTMQRSTAVIPQLKYTFRLEFSAVSNHCKIEIFQHVMVVTLKIIKPTETCKLFCYIFNID